MQPFARNVAFATGKSPDGFENPSQQKRDDVSRIWAAMEVMNQSQQPPSAT